MNDIKLKILVIGESGVGKSSLMLRFAEGKFDDNEVKIELFVFTSQKTETVVNFHDLITFP